MHSSITRAWAFRLGAGVFLALTHASCVAATAVQTADTLGQGQYQFAIEPGANGGSPALGQVAGAGGALFSGLRAFMPHLDFAFRAGATDTVDIGFRIGTRLVEVQSKFLLTDPENPDLAVALAPSAGLGALILPTARGGTPIEAVLQVSVPVLVGFKTTNGSELVIGSRVDNFIALPGAQGYVLAAGLELGIALRVSENLRLMPDIGVTLPVFAMRENGETYRYGGPSVTFKLGFLVGRGRSSIK